MEGISHLREEVRRLKARVLNIESKLGNLSVIGIGGSIPAVFHFETIGLAQANVINFSPVYINQDGRGEPAVFIRDNFFTGNTSKGIDGFVDASGQKFKRFSNE